MEMKVLLEVLLLLVVLVSVGGQRRFYRGRPPPGRGGVPISIPSERERMRPGPGTRPNEFRRYGGVLRPPPFFQQPTRNFKGQQQGQGHQHGQQHQTHQHQQTQNKLVIPFPPNEDQRPSSSFNRPVFEVTPSRQTAQNRPLSQGQWQQSSGQTQPQPPQSQHLNQPQPQQSPSHVSNLNSNHQPQPQQTQHQGSQAQSQPPSHVSSQLSSVHQVGVSVTPPPSPPQPASASSGVAQLGQGLWHNGTGRIIQLHLPENLSSQQVIQIHLSSTPATVSLGAKEEYYGSTVRPNFVGPKVELSQSQKQQGQKHGPSGSPISQDHAMDRDEEYHYEHTARDRHHEDRRHEDKQYMDRHHEEKQYMDRHHEDRQYMDRDHKDRQYMDRHHKDRPEEKYSQPDPLYEETVHGGYGVRDEASHERSREEKKSVVAAPSRGHYVKPGSSRYRPEETSEVKYRPEETSESKYRPEETSENKYKQDKYDKQHKHDNKQPRPEEILAALGFGVPKSDEEKVVGARFPWEEDREDLMEEQLRAPGHGHGQSPDEDYSSESRDSPVSYHHQSQSHANYYTPSPVVYVTEPEPIIEIIVQDSNITLTRAPTRPTLPTAAPTPEPVHVFYVRYSSGNKSEGVKLEMPRGSISSFGPVGQSYGPPGPPGQSYGPSYAPAHGPQGPSLEASASRPVYANVGPAVSGQGQLGLGQQHGPGQQSQGQAGHGQQQVGPNQQYAHGQHQHAQPNVQQQQYQQPPSYQHQPYQQQYQQHQQYQQTNQETKQSPWQQEQYQVPSTTLRALINPDQNSYSSSHLKVAFDQPGAFGTDNGGEASVQRPAFAVPGSGPSQASFVQEHGESFQHLAQGGQSGYGHSAHLAQPGPGPSPHNGPTGHHQQGQHLHGPTQQAHDHQSQGLAHQPHDFTHQAQHVHAHSHQATLTQSESQGLAFTSQLKQQSQGLASMIREEQEAAAQGLVSPNQNRDEHHQHFHHSPGLASFNEHHNQQSQAQSQSQGLVNQHQSQTQTQPQQSQGLADQNPSSSIQTAVKHQPNSNSQGLSQSNHNQQSQHLNQVNPQSQSASQQPNPQSQVLASNNKPEHSIQPSQPDPIYEDPEPDLSMDPVWSQYGPSQYLAKDLNSYQTLNPSQLNTAFASRSKEPLILSPPPTSGYLPLANPGGVSRPLGLRDYHLLGSENHMVFDNPMGLEVPAEAYLGKRMGEEEELGMPEELRRELEAAGILDQADVQVLNLNSALYQQLTQSPSASSIQPHSDLFSGATLSLAQLQEGLGGRSVRRVWVVNNKEEHATKTEAEPGRIKRQALLLVTEEKQVILLDEEKRTLRVVL